MTPYSVTLHRHDTGKRQCCFKALDAEAARARVKRSYPGCTVLEVRRREAKEKPKTRAVNAEAVKRSNEARAGKQAASIARAIKLVQSGMTTVYEIADAMGLDHNTIRKCANTAARAGHVKIRYDKSRGGLMILEAVR